MRSVPAQLRNDPENDALSPKEEADHRERYRKLAALIREWETGPAGHGKEFWPVLEAELDRHDDD